MVSTVNPTWADESWTRPGPSQKARKGYGEWRIQVRPDQVDEFNQLMEPTGRDLMQDAGGHLVG